MKKRIKIQSLRHINCGLLIAECGIKSKISLLFTVYCLLFTLLSSCSPQKEKIFRKNTILMDTLITINVVSDSEDKAEKAIGSAFSVIEDLDNKLNFFSDKSELFMINKNAGISEVKVSLETLDVIEKAVFVSEMTEGSFDPTIGPEISLWDFNAHKKPDDKSIKARLNLVNYKLIVIDKEKSTVYLKKKGMLIDLGGIAKGYAADKAVEELKKHGVKAVLVSCAGDIRAFGLKPDGKAWKVGIRNPRQKGKENEVIATIELKDMAVSTSGDYERYFIIDNIRYHHILDPKTGYPASGVQSVSVMTEKGVNTDAFSTAIFVLGPVRGFKIFEKMGFEGVIIDGNGKMQISSGLRNKIELNRNN